MNHQYTITHYYHSGFSVSCEDTLLVFDYWRGEEGELTAESQISTDQIRSFPHVAVLISHEHPDHLDPVVFSWKDLTNVSYIVSSDMPVGTRGKRMAPSDTFSPFPGVDITAFDSTDLGVSYLVSFHGLKIFHAGDLNFWHWREESTMQEIEEADNEFRKAVAPISKESVDIAFFPVDPRQGSMFEAGANYFILSVKPRILIPMHYFHRADVALEYARTATCRSTEVIAMPLYGDSMTLETDKDGFFNIHYHAPAHTGADSRSETNPPERANSEKDTALPSDSSPAPVSGMPDQPGSILSEEDPFSESDLPVSQLFQSEEEGASDGNTP